MGSWRGNLEGSSESIDPTFLRVGVIIPKQKSKLLVMGDQKQTGRLVKLYPLECGVGIVEWCY